MYNFNDIQLARDRYEEAVRDVEISMSYKRDESGAAPPRANFSEQVAEWKEFLHKMATPFSRRPKAYQRVR